MKKIYSILVCMCILAGFVACEKDKEFVLTTLSVTGEMLAPTYEAATIQCKLSADATISEAYVHYSLTSSFEDYKEVKMELVHENYSVLLLNLADNTTYYIRYKVSNKYSQVISKSVNSFKTERLTTPTVLLGPPSEIQETQAKVVMSVVYDGGCSVTEMGVCWSTSSNPTKQNSHTRYDGFAIDAVLEITDLQPNTTYYVRAYAVNKVGVAYSEERSFTTLSDVQLPTLSTSTITQITETTAVAGGNVTSDGNASVTERGVCISTVSNPTTSNTKITAGSGTGSFTCNLTGLQPNTTYYVRAYAINSKGTAYGTQVTFTTSKSVVLPTVTTSTVTQIMQTTAVAGGTVTSDGNAGVTERGVVYSLSANPAITDLSSTIVRSGSGTGTFTCNLSNLQAGTTYYVRAYAINSKGTAYGDEISFTTALPITLATVTTASIAQITETTAVAGGTVTSDGNAGVTERGVCVATASNPTTSNTKITSGSGTGSFICNLTGLQPNTTYYVRAYAINSKGTAYGDEISFTTALPITLATVTTASITQITETTAVAGGTVTSDGNASVTERGVVYSTNPNPVITNLYNTIKPCGSGTGSFICDLTNLQPNTTYYVRAYATNEMGTAYGEEVSFTTEEEETVVSDPTGTENGYGYVDLGLSVKWATCNVGASQPDEYGDYFAWGETEPKSIYDWSTYKWGYGSYELTKYCTNSEGIVDNKTTLELSDDAAHANWGGSWRMPTQAEQDELHEQCTWTWTSQNGVYGYKVTSKSNGNSIFLPAAGNRDDSSLELAGSYGYYWSSSLDTGAPYHAYYLGFHSNNVDWYFNPRVLGFSVRPVLGESEEEVTDPTVTTAAITQITETTAVAGGNVTSDGNASVTERGVVYSTNQNPTTADTKVAAGSGMGSFTCNLTDLQPNTTYYVRAYATNSMGTAYGEEVSFTTEEEVVAIPEYVDLGLSVKWATFNVGATKPEDLGDYFAWGETEPKSTYDWSTYKWCNGSYDSLTKYCTNSNYGRVDNKTTLELSDDAAYVNWGGSWRMPTDAELTELREQCTWTWTSQNGVNGYKVTSKSNGNSIFLPAAGSRNVSSLSNAGSRGYYWSSSLDTGDLYAAWLVGFYSSYVYRNFSNRFCGHSVRPVCP